MLAAKAALLLSLQHLAIVGPESAWWDGDPSLVARGEAILAMLMALGALVPWRARP